MGIRLDNMGDIRISHPRQNVIFPYLLCNRGYSNFLLNMAFISPSGGKYLYFMSGEATNDIYIFFTSRVK